MRPSSLRFVAPVTAISIAVFSGCADAPTELPERVGQGQTQIINGIEDSTHDAVVALFGNSGACSGTIIHHEIGTGSSYILTAAHCFEGGAMQQVAIGDDYQFASQVLSVVDWDQHPQWNPNQLAYDFAMIRAVGGNSSTPSIPVLTPEEDTMASGTALVHVGYGVLSAPNGSTSQRHYATGYVNETAQTQFDYAQPNMGPCSGDSGGPNLVDMGQGERVAGVISYGDETCATYGVSGRVSSVSEFINDFVGIESPSTSATTTTGVGGGGSTSTGVGGAAPGSGSGFFAGDTEAENYEGDLLTSSSCAVSTPSPARDDDGAWLLLVLLGLGFTRRTRLAKSAS